MFLMRHPYVLVVLELARANGPCRRDKEIAALPSYACYMYDAPPTTPEKPIQVRVYNTFPETLNAAWDDGTPEGVFNGQVPPGEPLVLTSYVTHSFMFTNLRNAREVRARVTVENDKPFYFIGPGVTEDMSPHLKKKVQEAVDFVAFADDYKTRTGMSWQGDNPPQPLRHNLLKADFVGQSFNVTVPHGHWTCADTKACAVEPLQLQVIVASVMPRILIVENFLHDAERELVRKLAILGKATVGQGAAYESQTTRRSDVGWLDWYEPWSFNLLQRTAELLGFDADDLRGKLAESLQVLRYKKRGKYSAHYDYGSEPYDRMLTLLHYIEGASSDSHNGGTGFPLAFGGKGLVLNPPGSQSILFYSMLLDGNKDRLALHEAVEVQSGEKMVCNSWVHDRHPALEDRYKPVTHVHSKFVEVYKSDL